MTTATRDTHTHRNTRTERYTSVLHNTLLTSYMCVCIVSFSLVVLHTSYLHTYKHKHTHLHNLLYAHYIHFNGP